MEGNDIPAEGEDSLIECLKQELAQAEPTTRGRLAEAFVMAVLGSLPWVGGVLTAAAAFKYGDASARQDRLQTQWLLEHQQKLHILRDTLAEIGRRFESLGSEIDSRIASEEYLGLVRKSFRAWDQADTQQKRGYSANIIVNSAGSRVCSDDVVRLFLEWLTMYHEIHFTVIREVFENPGSTRFEIWNAIYPGDLPRDDSAEADLFRLVIHDLSTGRVIRQDRDTNHVGQFVRKRPRTARKGSAPTTLKSAFDDDEQYVLTELGKQFVHYTMSEVVGRLGDIPGDAAHTSA